MEGINLNLLKRILTYNLSGTRINTNMLIIKLLMKFHQFVASIVHSYVMLKGQFFIIIDN
jgi:hypothetical protein